MNIEKEKGIERKLSVIILNYNVRYFLELCLKSVIAATNGLNSEIIVVDNNSEDGSCDMVKKMFPQVRLFENKENLGFSKGNNLGIAAARGEFLCILNPDTVLGEDTFKEILSFFNTTNNIGVVGCKLINGAGVFLPESKRNIPYPFVALKKLFGNSNRYYANHLAASDNGQVDILVGAFMFMKKEVFDSVNGFDEDFFMYGEDIDLSFRIKKRGYNNYYFGKLTAIHFKGESTLRDRLYLKRFFGAMKIFYKKHFKNNFVIDFFVFMGIKLAYLNEKKGKAAVKDDKDYVLISKSNLNRERLEKIVCKPIKVDDISVKTSKNEELIFDGNYFSYKDIIQYMAKNNHKGLTFKILPSESAFIIGSDNGFERGEILEF